jgi:hypothetical protein
LRTPFNPMSNAARMEATRLAPAGRACSKFVWQSRFQKTGRFGRSRARAALSFLAIIRLYIWKSPIYTCRLRIAAQPAQSRGSGDSSLQRSVLALLKRGGDPGRDSNPSLQMRSGAVINPSAPCARAGHVVASIRGHSSTAEMRRTRTAETESALSGRIGGRMPCSPAGSEFVSEFETKRDQ